MSVSFAEGTSHHDGGKWLRGPQHPLPNRIAARTDPNNTVLLYANAPHGTVFLSKCATGVGMTSSFVPPESDRTMTLFPTEPALGTVGHTVAPVRLGLVAATRGFRAPGNASMASRGPCQRSLGRHS